MTEPTEGTVEPVAVWLRVGASPEYQIGVVHWPTALPALLRAVADEMEHPDPDPGAALEAGP